MTEGNTTVTIASLIEKGVIVAHKDGNYGSLYPRTHEFGDDGVPLLTAKLVSDSGEIDFHSAPRLNTQKAETLYYGFIESNDVLLSHNATVGRVALVPELRERMLVGTSLTYFRVDSKRLIPRYLAAYFKGKGFQDQLHATMSHSTRNQVPITAQRQLTIELPALSQQHEIASVLGSLDDKIELNRRMNRTLEQMAAAIFKAWFVDFDPVRAKASGATTFPGMPQPAFDALPTTFQDSPLGPIPQGWKLKTLKDATRLTMGQSPKSEFYNDTGEGLPFHQGVTNYGERFPIHKQFCTIDKRTAEPGDILFSVRAPVGRINVADQKLIVGRGLAAIRHHEEWQSLLLYALKHQFAEEDSIGDGTIFKAVTKKDMENIRLVQPDKEVGETYEQIVSTIDQQIGVNDRESRTLTETRDTLLPKLLSGDIRIPKGTGVRNISSAAMSQIPSQGV